MSEYIHKSHNVSVLLYHLVFPAKYRRAVFDESVDPVLGEVCLEIERRYEIKFIEIGVDRDHVHFLVQSVPTYSVRKIVKLLKSLTAREIFKQCPQVKRQLWGGEFWTDGYFASTVGKHGDEGMIASDVKDQDKEYLQLLETVLSSYQAELKATEQQHRPTTLAPETAIVRAKPTATVQAQAQFQAAHERRVEQQQVKKLHQQQWSQAAIAQAVGVICGRYAVT